MAGTSLTDWLGLVATIGLLVVTFWYAKTTKGMAETAATAAEDSARATQAAERSAEAALEATRVAQSQIVPDFDGYLIAVYESDEPCGHVSCIQVFATGDPVVVRGVRVRRAFRDFAKLALADAELTPHGSDSELPRRLHKGEQILVTHPEFNDLDKGGFKRLILDVEYTFAEEGSTGGKKELIVDA